MTLKTERAVNEAVTQLNTSNWKKAKRWGKKVLLATVSTFGFVAGMMGTAQQMQAQNREVVEVSINDLNAYLSNRRGTTVQTKQQQYAQVYANRDNCRRQHQQAAAYGSAQWLEERGLEYDVRLSRNINRREYLGAFIDWNSVDRYGTPTQVVYLPVNPNNRPVKTNMDDAQKMCKHPGGDTLGIYRNPNGPDTNNPENNPSWNGYGGGYYDYPRGASKEEKVIRAVDAAARTGHFIYHIVKGHHR